MRSDTTIELAAPAMLVAMPQLRGGPFGEAVLLLLQHDEAGSMGLVLNHATDVTLQAFCDGLDVSLAPSRRHDAVHVGGPVEPERAFVLHASDHRGPETRVILPPVAMSFSMESLHLLAKTPPRDLRVCVGYAGWAAGQLAKEITAGSWMVTVPTTRFLFDTPPAQMWHEALGEMGIEPLQLVHSSRLN